MEINQRVKSNLNIALLTLFYICLSSILVVHILGFSIEKRYQFLYSSYVFIMACFFPLIVRTQKIQVWIFALLELILLGWITSSIINVAIIVLSVLIVIFIMKKIKFRWILISLTILFVIGSGFKILLLTFGTSQIVKTYETNNPNIFLVEYESDLGATGGGISIVLEEKYGKLLRKTIRNVYLGPWKDNPIVEIDENGIIKINNQFAGIIDD
jgi:hypothetical protein